MSTEKEPRKFLLQFSHPLAEAQAIQAGCPAAECNIELQVGEGWAIRGSYRNQTLSKVTLQKTYAAEGG